MPEFIGSFLTDEVKIDKLYTVHFFEYPKYFKFTGERHDFWELVYVEAKLPPWLKHKRFLFFRAVLFSTSPTNGIICVQTT